MKLFGGTSNPSLTLEVCNYLGVEPERPVIDILKVQPNPVFEIDIVASVHLPETSQTRSHRELAMLPRLELAYFGRQRRAL